MSQKCLCGIALMTAATVHAESNGIQLTDSAMQLAANNRFDTVVVSASRAETPLSQTSVSIAQINRESIDDKAPAFAGEVLNTIAGVHMTDLGNEQHSMSIRQPMTTAPVYLYLEDGMPIRPLGLFNHNSLYEVNLDGTSRVEIIKGPASSLYGSNSVGGTVNFLTEAPSKDFSAKVGAQGSDQGYWRTDANVSDTNGNVGGRLSGYVSRRNGGWQVFNDAQKESLTGRIDWQIADSTKIKTVLTYNHLLTDMPGSLFEDDYKNRPGFSYNTFAFREVYASRESVAVEGDWLDIGTTTLTLYTRQNSTEQNPSYLIFNTTNPAIASGRHNDSDFTSLGFDARQLFNFAWLESRLVAGLTAENTDSDYNEDNLSIARRPADGKYLSYAFTSHRRDFGVKLENRAAYAQYELTPLTDVRVVLGARYDNISYDYSNHRTPSASTGAPSETREFSHVSPKLGAIWSLSADQNIYFNHAQGFTPPEVTALYSSLNVPNLQESVFTNNEIGWRSSWLNNALAINAAIYRLEGEDEVVSYSIAPGLSESRNAGKTLHQGIELGAGWRFSPEWEANLALAYSEHEYRKYQVSSTLDYSGKDIPGGPAWIGNTTLRWTPAFSSGFSAELEWSYLGSYEMNNANTVEYGGFNLFNLRLAYSFEQWRVWLKGANLADKKYAETASSSFSGVGAYTPNSQNTYSPGNPRTASLGIEYRFGNE